MVGEDRLASDLYGAVDRGEIVAHYQPQVDLATDRIVAAEALARWRHPELGLISPAIFIPIAEETALIHSLGRFMIDEVLTSPVFRKRMYQLDAPGNPEIYRNNFSVETLILRL